MFSVLRNKVFISTRPKGKSGELDAMLTSNGAIHMELPMIELRESIDEDITSDILINMQTYTHLVFTSANGFLFFMNQMRNFKDSNNILHSIKIASIGYKTTETILSKGYNIDFDANAKTGTEFAKKFKKHIAGKEARVLWPTSKLSPNIIPDSLDGTAHITRLNIYTNNNPTNIDYKLVNRVKSDAYDMIICASPSAFFNLIDVVKNKNLRIACIGRTTAEAVKNHGITPLCVAKEPNALGIFNAITKYYNSFK